MDAEQLSIATSETDGKVLIHLEGDLDFLVAPDLTATASRCIALEPECIDVDAGGLQFIDSSGVRALFLACQQAAASGVAFRVVQASDVADRAFGMAGVRRILLGEVPPPRPGRGALGDER